MVITLDDAAKWQSITVACYELSQYYNDKLLPETTAGTYGWIVKIYDATVFDELTAKTSYTTNEAKEVATFEVELPKEIFTDADDETLDILCDIKYKDDLYTKAKKRCKYLIKQEFTRWVDQIRIVDKDFLRKEAAVAITDINATFNLQLYIKNYKYDFGELTIYVTDKRLPADVTTGIIISKEEYTDDNSPYDGLIGDQHMKLNDWKFNGRLRTSYIIFQVFKNWVKQKYPEQYKHLLKK